MKIVAISDTHGQKVKNLPKADLLIHSGDWSSSGTFKETNDFLIWMSQIRMNYKKVICVPGNHDRWVESNQFTAEYEFRKLDIDLLIDKSIMFENHLIYGMPWTPEFGSWSFMANDIERQDRCDAIPCDTTILVTHGPPQGYLDVLAANGSQPGAHIGCQFIKKAMETIKPFLHIFGHIHEGAGIEVHDQTLLINASCMDEYYRLVNGFKVVYL